MVFRQDPKIKAVLGRFFTEHKQFILRVALVFGVLTVLTALGTGAQAYIMKPMVDDVLTTLEEKKTLKFAFITLGVFTYMAAVIFVTKSFETYITSQMMRRLRQSLTEKLLYADMKFYHHSQRGDLASRLTNDSRLAAFTLTHGLVGFKSFITILGLLGLLFYQSPTFAGLTMLLGGATIPVMIFVGKRKKIVAKREQTLEGEFLGAADEVFGGIECIKSFSREPQENKALGSTVAKVANRQFQLGALQGVMLSVGQLLQGLAILVFVIFGAVLIKNQTITLGVFFMAFTVLLLVYRNFQMLMGSYTMAIAGAGPIERLYEILDHNPQVQDPPKPARLPTAPPHIQFEGVDFSYSDKDNKPHPQLFSGLNLDFAPHKITALVGHSGSGKSTTVSLIMRFMDVEGGKITLNGTDIRHLKVAELRSKFSFVSQDTTLFSDTVMNNILYGNPSTSASVAKGICRRLGIEEAFINRLHGGYDTMVGPDGVMLSGGQRQLVSIARAMLKDAPLLILDEATASIDTKLEKTVHNAIGALSANRTVIVIAHRLATVKDAQLIYVLEGGKVVESGSHKELIAKKGSYEEMVNRQLLAPQEGEQAAGEQTSEQSGEQAAGEQTSGQTSDQAASDQAGDQAVGSSPNSPQSQTR